MFWFVLLLTMAAPLAPLFDSPISGAGLIGIPNAGPLLLALPGLAALALGAARLRDARVLAGAAGLPLLYLAARLAFVDLSHPLASLPVAGAAGMLGAALWYAGRDARPALADLGLPLAALALLGLITDPNCIINRVTLGTALLLPFDAALVECSEFRSMGGGRVRSFIYPALIGLGIVAAGSRGAWVGAALIVLGRLRLWQWAPLLGLAAPLALEARNPRTWQIHRAIWADAWATWRAHPWLGSGALPLDGGSMHAHNVVLGLLAGAGVFGAALIGLGIWDRGRRAAQRRAAQRLPYGLIGLMVAGLFTDWAIAPLVMVQVGAIVSVAAEQRPYGGDGLNADPDAG